METPATACTANTISMEVDFYVTSRNATSPNTCDVLDPSTANTLVSVGGMGGMVVEYG